MCKLSILSASLLLIFSSALWSQQVPSGISQSIQSEDSIAKILQLLDGSDQAMTQLEASLQEWSSQKEQLLAQLNDSEEATKRLEKSLETLERQNSLLTWGLGSVSVVAVAECLYIAFFHR